MKKRLLIENDLPELSDFQKLLLLNKGKLNYEDVEFIDKDGDNYPNIIEVTKHGLLFHFDDLEEFLKFFFPDSYGKDANSDLEWDAINYDRMYYGQYDFSDNCYDSSNSDWDEGYTLGYLCQDALFKLRELFSIISPQHLKHFKIEGSNISLSGEGELAGVLSDFFPRSSDDITETHCNSKHYMLKEEASKYLGDIFCDGLRPFGIENWSKNHCFRTYFISWGHLIQLYLYDGEFDGDALDVMFNYLEKNFKGHPSVYYEIEYNIWDQKTYNDHSCDNYVTTIDEYIEIANEEFNPDYIESISRLNKLKLFDFKKIPGDNNYWIKVIKVDPETLKVRYLITANQYGTSRKEGLSTVDDVIAMSTQPGLFDQMDFRVDPK